MAVNRMEQTKTLIKTLKQALGGLRRNCANLARRPEMKTLTDKQAVEKRRVSYAEVARSLETRRIMENG